VIPSGAAVANDYDFGELEVDLSITKDDGQTTYVPGQTVTYTIVVTNNGVGDVTGAVVTDQLPAGTSFLSATNGATYDPTSDMVTFLPGTLAAGGGSDSFQLTLAAASIRTGDLVNTTVVTPPPGTTDLTPGNNTATVTAPPGFVDPTPANNIATDIDEVEPRVDLAVTKTDGRETYQAGATTTYTVIVTNDGPGTAVGAHVVDTAPGLGRVGEIRVFEIDGSELPQY